MRKLFYLLLLICWHSTIYAQKENSHWYLGMPAAIDFSGNSPEIVPMHAIGGYGGGASMSDANGDLLFYTNGVAFFTKDHEVMPGTENFSGHRTATYFKLYMYNGADSLDYININNFYNTDIKIVQLDKSKPRYHVFYLTYPSANPLYNEGVFNINQYSSDLSLLAYSIIDMSLNNGKGGIDPLYKNVIVDSQLTRHFDIWSDGQCGVWIVVNKLNQTQRPVDPTLGQSNLLSYLLQPNGNIMLVNSQPEFYLPTNYPQEYAIYRYNAPILRFLGNGKYLSTQYEFDIGLGQYSTRYALFYRKAILRLFDYRTGKLSTIIDTIGDKDGLDTNGIGYRQNVYINDSNSMLYHFDYRENIAGISSYDAKLIGNQIAFEQSKTTFDLFKYVKQKYNFIHNDDDCFTENSRFRKGPDGALYFTFNVQRGNEVFTALARIPNPNMSIDSNNFEIVDTVDIVKIFNDFGINMQNHTNQQKLRGGRKAHSNYPYFQHLTQIGTNAIIYEPKAVATLVADTVICPGQSFYVQSPYPQYDNLWQPNNTQGDSLLINQAGEYTLTTTAPHCTFTSTYKVTAVEESLSIAQNDTAICTQRPITLQAELKNISQMQWNTGSKETSITVNESGQYIASATGICGPLADTVTITASDCSCLHFVPNAFTPNNDGLNDQLYTYLHCEPRQYRFHVYNRWGKLVWFSDNVQQQWDGTEDGQPADMGVYFYLLEYRDPLNEKQSHTGEVHLIR